VLGLNDVGRLTPGYRADVLVLDAPDWRYLAYHLGGDRFATRIKSGRVLA
jgi:imidazolonepropionase-like amidohydrolase